MAKHFICHVEFPADNAAAASKFYADLFDWKIEGAPEIDYHMFHPESGPGGAFVQAGEHGYEAGKVLVYVSTDDIDASLAKAESLGAKTIVPKSEIPGNGWFAIFSDPTGNKVALYTAPTSH